MKGQVSGLMKLILIAVSLIILIFVGMKLKDFAQEATQEGSCAWSFVAARLTSGDVPAGCKRKIIEINDEALAKYKVEADKTIKSYTASSNPDLHTLYTKTLTGSKAVTRWAINALVSDELVSCVQKSRGSGIAFKDVAAFSGKTVCVACAEFVMSDKVKLELGIQSVNVDHFFLKNRFYQEGRDFVSGWSLIDSAVNVVDLKPTLGFSLPVSHSALIFGSHVLPASASVAEYFFGSSTGTFLRLDDTKSVLMTGAGDRFACSVVIG